MGDEILIEAIEVVMGDKFNLPLFQIDFRNTKTGRSDRCFIEIEELFDALGRALKYVKGSWR